MGSVDVSTKEATPMAVGSAELSADTLRAKYSQPRDEIVAKSARAAPGKPAQGLSADANDRLSKVKICSACNANGTIKRQYGYRVMDEVCEKCDGEGCIIENPKQASPETMEKI